MPQVNSKPFEREILNGHAQEKTTETLQANLTNFVDLALLLKQAHWNVVGRNFRSVHLQLDEILETVRAASDEIAERMDTLGAAPDGRSSTVAARTSLAEYPEGFQGVDATVKQVSDALKSAIDELRAAIEVTGDLDPVTEDLLIGIAGPVEKHLWMLQAQEV